VGAPLPAPTPGQVSDARRTVSVSGNPERRRTPRDSRSRLPSRLTSRNAEAGQHRVAFCSSIRLQLDPDLLDPKPSICTGVSPTGLVPASRRSVSPPCRRNRPLPGGCLTPVRRRSRGPRCRPGERNWGCGSGRSVGRCRHAEDAEGAVSPPLGNTEQVLGGDEFGTSSRGRSGRGAGSGDLRGQAVRPSMPPAERYRAVGRTAYLAARRCLPIRRSGTLSTVTRICARFSCPPARRSW